MSVVTEDARGRGAGSARRRARDQLGPEVTLRSVEAVLKLARADARPVGSRAGSRFGRVDAGRSRGSCAPNASKPASAEEQP